jgi:heptaprenyl diphosphate synthase
MPYLVLGQRTDAASVALLARIDDGVERIAGGEDPSILDAELAELREHEATSATLDLAHAWSNEAVAALEALPDGAVREALTRFAQAVADRSS